MSEPEVIGHALTAVPFGKHFRWTATGLDILGEPSYSVTAAFGEQARTLEASMPFVLGDYLNYIADRFPEQKDQIIADCGWSFETVRNYRWMARNIPRANRMMHLGLGVQHHQAVAKLPPPEQKRWLQKALGPDNGDGPPQHWPASRLKAEVKASTTGGRLVVTRWHFRGTCASAQEREKIVRLLEREGVLVHTYESREVEN